MTLGIAALVRAHGDNWRMGHLDAYDRGELLLGRALLLSDGLVRDDQREAYRMSDWETERAKRPGRTERNARRALAECPR